MASAEQKNVNSPDETRPFEKGKVEVVKIGGGTVGRATFAALGLVAYGALVVFVPDLLPTFMSMDGGSAGGMDTMGMTG